MEEREEHFHDDEEMEYALSILRYLLQCPDCSKEDKTRALEHLMATVSRESRVSTYDAFVKPCSVVHEYQYQPPCFDRTLPCFLLDPNDADKARLYVQAPECGVLQNPDAAMRALGISVYEWHTSPRHQDIMAMYVGDMEKDVLGRIIMKEDNMSKRKLTHVLMWEVRRIQ